MIKRRGFVLGAAVALIATTAIAGKELVTWVPNWQQEFTLAAQMDDHRGFGVIMEIWVNDIALRSAGKDEFDSGAIVYGVIYRALQDANDQPIVDANGVWQKDMEQGVRAHTAMEKRAGWGVWYRWPVRNGEWEYANFNAEGVRSDRDTLSCFECHGDVADLDYVYTKFQILEAAD